MRPNCTCGHREEDQILLNENWQLQVDRHRSDLIPGMQGHHFISPVYNSVICKSPNDKHSLNPIFSSSTALELDRPDTISHMGLKDTPHIPHSCLQCSSLWGELHVVTKLVRDVALSNTCVAQLNEMLGPQHCCHLLVLCPKLVTRHLIPDLESSPCAVPP